MSRGQCGKDFAPNGIQPAFAEVGGEIDCAPSLMARPQEGRG